MNFVVSKAQGKPMLKVVVKERNKDVSVLKEEVLSNFKGDIIFKLVSSKGKYQYSYSLDGGASYMLFVETADDLVICKGYIGTNIGLYATSNGRSTKEYADFDWVSCNAITRK